MNYTEIIQQYYLAYFGRAADTGGLALYLGRVNDADEADVDAVLAGIRSEMGSASQPEFAAIYGEDVSDADFFDRAYANILNRAADAEGAEYWIGVLEANAAWYESQGDSAADAAAKARADVLSQLINAALDDDAAPTDKATFANKTAAAIYITESLDGLSEEEANEVLDGTKELLADAAIGEKTEAELEGAVDGVVEDVTGEGEGEPGETVMLTTGRDYVGPTDPETPADFANIIKTTAGNDTVEAVVSALSAENTLNATDVLDGGEGTQDTAKINLQSNFSGFAATGKMANFENIELSNATAITRSFDAKGVTGAKVYSLDSARGISLSNLESTGLTVVEKGLQSNVSIGFASGVTLTGTADAMSLELQGVGAAKTDSAAQVNPKITMAGIEVVDVKSAGSANFVDLSGVTELTTLTITGDQALKVSDVATKVTKVDGSAATGSLDLSLSVGTAAAVTSVQTGAADDIVSIDAADLQANAIVAGGAGTDVLKLNDTAAAGSTLQLNQSGFETVQVTGVAAGQTLSISGANTTDVTAVQLDANTTASGAVSFVNAGAGDLAVNVVGGAVAGQALSVDNAGTANVTVKTTAKQATDAATVIGATTTSASSVTATNAANAVFTVGQFVTQSGDFVANKATSVTLNVESGKNTAATPAELTSFSGDLDALKATSVTVEAKGKLDGAEINAAEATSAVINTGATASTADLILNKATDLQVTSKGNFTALAASSNLRAVQSATLATDGVLVVDTALSDIAALTISGANSKSSFSNNAKAVGDVNMDHVLNVTASGLKSGFTLTGAIAAKQAVTITSSDVTGVQNIGTTIVGSDVTLTSSGATGAVTYGKIDAAVVNTGTATVNAKGNTGNIVVGTIGATTLHKTVSVDVSGALGTVKLGKIESAGTVTLNAKDSLKAIDSDGAGAAVAIEAVTGVNITAGLKKLDVNVDIANTGTSGAFAGVVNGSIEGETFAFKVLADAKADVTLTGDMGLGTDIVNVDASAVTTVANTVKIDISGVQNYETATLIGGAGNDTIKGGAGDDTIKGGKGDDTIELGAGGNDTVVFEVVANNGKDTIVGFNAGTDALTKDVLQVSGLATLGDNGTKTVFQKANASSADKASVVTASITTNGNGVITLKDQAAADWSDVATVIGNALTVDGTAINNSEFVILVDNGTDTRIYSYKDVADGFDAGDITLVGTVSAVQTYTTTGVFDATNFA